MPHKAAVATQHPMISFLHSQLYQFQCHTHATQSVLTCKENKRLQLPHKNKLLCSYLWIMKVDVRQKAPKHIQETLIRPSQTKKKLGHSSASTTLQTTSKRLFQMESASFIITSDFHGKMIRWKPKLMKVLEFCFISRIGLMKWITHYIWGMYISKGRKNTICPTWR